MKHGLEPVLFPGQDFHVLFRLRMASQDPLPVVTRFLRRALKEGLLDRTPVVGRVLTPLGYVAVLEDSRLAAFVYVQWGETTYASHYTIFPSRSNLRRWRRLASEMGDTRFLEADAGEDGDMGDVPRNPRGLRWCPYCEGLNGLGALRCLWCRRPLPPAHGSLPEGSVSGGTTSPAEA